MSIIMDYTVPTLKKNQTYTFFGKYIKTFLPIPLKLDNRQLVIRYDFIAGSSFGLIIVWDITYRIFSIDFKNKLHSFYKGSLHEEIFKQF